MDWTLVTGGAKGLGAAICRRLAAASYPVVIHYNRSGEEAQKLAAECRAFGTKAAVIQGDFSTIQSVQHFIEHYLECFSETTHLVNNVGNYLKGSPEDTAPHDLMDLLQTNLVAPVQVTQALLPSLKRNRGTVTNIGVVGLNPVPPEIHSTAYTSSKLGLWMWTRSLARALASDGIRVNMVSPGYMENSVDLPSAMDQLPFGRLARLDEVARVVQFIIDPASNYITGQNIEVGGGVRL